MLQEYKSALQFLYGLFIYFEDLWVLLILVITCPFNPIQFDTNELNDIRLFLEAIPNAEKAIRSLNTQWYRMDSEFTRIKISILDLFGKNENARLIAK